MPRATPLTLATLTIAGNERRRAYSLPRGEDRADAMGWARDLLATARRWRLNH